MVLEIGTTGKEIVSITIKEMKRMTGMTTAVVEEINPETPDTAEFLET